MSDPLEDRLRDFAAGVPALSPSSPAEVRRRGDRLRKRRTILVTAGAALAVAVVTAPVLALTSSDRATEQPSLPSTSVTTTSSPAPTTAPPPVQPSSPPTTSDTTDTTDAPDDPETTTTAPPAPPPLTEARLPSAGDLPALEGVAAWQTSEPADDWLIGCQPDVGVDGGLEAVDRVTRSYDAVSADVPPGADEELAAQVRVTVLQMGSVAEAEVAEDTVTGWLRDCDNAIKPILAEASRADLVVTDDGTYVARSYYAGAEVCGEGCDAVWYDDMGVVASQERLVVVSLRKVGGQEAPDGLDAAMRDLLSLVSGLN